MFQKKKNTFSLEHIHLINVDKCDINITKKLRKNI